MSRWIQIWGAVAAVSTALVAPSSGVLVADYQFANSLQSSVGSPPDLQNIGGSNAFVADVVDGQPRTVLQFQEGDGVALNPTTGVISSNIYTIVVLFRFDAVSGYRRIVDFKNATSDTGLYNLSGSLNFYNSATGPSAVIPANTYVQVALTRDGGGTVVGYVDGAPQFSFVDSSNDGVISASNTLRFFVDDTVVPDEESAGAVARIRLFDTALSASEVAALSGSTSAAAPALAPSTLALLACILAAAGMAALRRRQV